MNMSKTLAEILVEGELSPFEHEALYKLLKKHFRLEQPAYSELLDETIGTRVNIIFHHPYERSFFTSVFHEDWRDLKDLFKQVRYRRGRLGAAFTLTFADEKIRLTFSSGLLGDEELGSAMDQIGHLTGIVGQMMRPETMVEPLEQVINAACPRDFLRVDHDEVLSRLFEDKMARLKLHQTFAFDTEPSPISITRNRRPNSPIFFN